MYGGSIYGSGSSGNEGPLALFLVAISTSASLAIWYLFINRQTRLIRTQAE